MFERNTGRGALGPLLRIAAGALAMVVMVACGNSAEEPGPSPTPPSGMFSTLRTTEPPVVGDQPPTIELNTPVPTFTPQPTHTPNPTYTPEPTFTPNPTGTPVPTPEPSATPVPTPNPTAMPQPTYTPQLTYTPAPLPTATPYPTATPNPTAMPTPNPKATIKPGTLPSSGSGAICDAVKSENPASVRILANAKVNVNVVCPGGNPPLYLAIREVFSSRFHGFSIRFHGRSSDGSLEIVRILLAAGADPSATDAKGDPLLYVAIDREHSNRFHGRESYTDVLEALVVAGANVNAKTADGNPVLYEAVNEEDSVRFHGRPPSTDTLRILIEAGADVSARSARGVSPLEQAIRDELPDIVKVLVDAGAR